MARTAVRATILCHSKIRILPIPYILLRQRNNTSLRAAREMASSSLHFLTVLTEDDGVSGFKFERKPEEYTVDQLKRWLKYRGLKLSGEREDIVQRVRDCVRNGNYHTLDPASIVENGLLLKFFKKILM